MVTSCRNAAFDAPRLPLTGLLGAMLLASALTACSSSSSTPATTTDSGTPVADAGKDVATPTPDASNDSSSTPDTGSSADTGTNPDTGTTADTGAPDTGSAATPLPFYVSDQFIPSGFMNDPNGITMSAGANGGAACPDRAPNPVGTGGSCYVISWASTGPAWAGVYWQYPSNNWGTEPGLAIAPGAKKVTFYAKGSVGGESVTFKTGGINDPLVSSVGTYGDTFQAAAPTATLTTTWTQYTIDLTGATYASGVLGGFVWVANAASLDGGVSAANNNNIKFYVDQLQWQ